MKAFLSERERRVEDFDNLPRPPYYYTRYRPDIDVVKAGIGYQCDDVWATAALVEAEILQANSGELTRQVAYYVTWHRTTPFPLLPDCRAALAEALTAFVDSPECAVCGAPFNHGCNIGVCSETCARLGDS